MLKVVPSLPAFSPDGKPTAFANPEDNSHNLDVVDLAKQAREAFAITELWQERTSYDHKPINFIMSGIVQQGRALSYAIKQSVATADAGYLFATDAISRCDRLADVRDQIAELENALQDMKKIVETAYQGSRDMNNQFKSIRVKLFAVHPTSTSTLPRASDNARTPAPRLDISNDRDRNGAGHFQKVTRDLDLLITHISSFVDWWAEMNASLQYIVSNLRFVTTDGSNPLRTIAVKEHWVTVKEKYASYRKQIHEVEDYIDSVSSEPYDMWPSDGKSDKESGAHQNTNSVRDYPSGRCCIIM